MTVTYRLTCRDRTAAEWTSLNEVLLAGEWGVETDLWPNGLKAKMGDGTTPWNSLGYAIDTTASGGGAWGTITGTLSDQTDLQAALDAKLDDSQLDTDGTLAANSDAKIASQKAVKTYADTKQAALSLTANTFYARSSSGAAANKSITDAALALLGDATVPRLGTTNTWALAQTFTAAPVFTDQSGTRTALGLGPKTCFETTIDFTANGNYGSALIGDAWRSNVSGTNANVTGIPAVGNRVGYVTFALGTTPGGRVAVIGGNGQLILGNGRAYFRARADLASLSDGTNTFTVRHGFITEISAESNDGVFFRYAHSVNSGKWQCVTRKANVETASDSGITAVAGTDRLFEIVVNAGGTSVDFKIDGSVVATHTTNIPVVGIGFGSMAVRPAGTASISAQQIDYMHVRVDLTVTR